MTIESSISSAPREGSAVKAGGMETTREALTTWNSDSVGVARALPLSLLGGSSFFAFLCGEVFSAACLRFLSVAGTMAAGTSARSASRPGNFGDQTFFNSFLHRPPTLKPQFRPSTRTMYQIQIDISQPALYRKL